MTTLPSPAQTHIFIPSHPTQAKPAQIHKLMPPTPPTLSHSLHNLPPEGNPIPASQTRLDANVISDYRRTDRHCLLFSSCLRPKRWLPSNQSPLHDCLFMIYGVKDKESRLRFCNGSLSNFIFTEKITFKRKLSTYCLKNNLTMAQQNALRCVFYFSTNTMPRASSVLELKLKYISRKSCVLFLGLPSLTHSNLLERANTLLCCILTGCEWGKLWLKFSCGKGSWALSAFLMFCFKNSECSFFLAQSPPITCTVSLFQ